MLARGMAKQHETYQDAVQELIDNAVSSVVSDERYFEDPDQSVEISINIVRSAATVTTVIADNGPGISYDTLREHVFRTGNKEKSDGILNNVGWGLKASVAWFEETIRQRRIEPEDPWFTLVTQTTNEGPFVVDGPLTGDLPIRSATETEWLAGVQHEATSLNEYDRGTRVHVDCARDRFDTDVWPSAERLHIKAQVLRGRLGVLFRRLLTAHPDNRIVIAYNDLETDTQGTLNVLPICPEYQTDIDEQDDGTPYQSQTFEVTTQSGTYTIDYECGTLDFEAMTKAVAKNNPGLLTHGGNFRSRYRPSQATQGIDIYANGRVLMTSVFSELFDLSRNNQYNYFGGILRIIPTNPEDTEVPTDNKKTRLDTNSELWRYLQDRFSTPEYQPVGKRYDDSGSPTETEADSDGDESTTDTTRTTQTERSTAAEADSQSIDGERYGLIQADSRQLKDHLSYFDTEQLDENLVDVTITSPPYADLKNYGYETDAQIGVQDSYQKYLSDLQNIFKQIYDITAQDGSLWVVINTFKQDGRITQLPADIARICQQLGGVPDCPECSSSENAVPLVPVATGRQYCCRNCGYISTGDEDAWQLQDIIIWDKIRALPYGETQFRNVFEYILCFSKQQDFRFDLDSVRIADPGEFETWWVDYPERYHPRGMVPANIWSMATPSQGAFGDGVVDHPAPFPPRLVEQIIKLTTAPNDVVLDPFAGSGTVLAQAEAMDRRPLGFELSSDYCDAYEAVKEYYAERWTSDEKTSFGEQQTQLTEIIGGLRQVKQVRELLRHLADAQGISTPTQLDISTAVHVCEELNQAAVGSGSFIETSIVFVVDEAVTPQRAASLETTAAELLSETPLSGYGITATPRVMTAAELQSAAASGEFPELQGQLYVYADGRHYEFAEMTTLDTWFDGDDTVGHNQVRSTSDPPILSTIGLDVKNPRRSSEETTSTNVHNLQKPTGESVNVEFQIPTQSNTSKGD